MDNKILKKISIIETTNFVLNDSYMYLSLSDSLDAPELNQLRNYVMTNIDLSNCKDPEIIFKILEWVSSQWKHDGMNEAPKEMSSYEIIQNAKKGVRYRCVEYGKVMTDILLSLGYISRKIGLLSKEPSYGGFGMAHVASEIWSNELGKWVFVDPQICAYAMYEGTYLNYYEMYKLKNEGLFDKIEFCVPPGYIELNNLKLDEYIKDYKEFIIMYFGYMNIQYIKNSKALSLNLYLDGTEQFLTFQGMQTNNSIFTNNPQDLYFPLNQTLLSFEYKNKINFSEISSKYNFETQEDYIKYMPYFAAKPDYMITLQNNMKWFSHYEINENDNGWTKLEASTFELSLKEGISTIAARAVNTAGNKGIPAYIKFKYSE